MAKYEQMTDEELIRRYREGDKAALDHIMEKYKDQRAQRKPMPCTFWEGKTRI